MNLRRWEAWVIVQYEHEDEPRRECISRHFSEWMADAALGAVLRGDLRSKLAFWNTRHPEQRAMSLKTETRRV